MLNSAMVNENFLIHDGIHVDQDTCTNLETNYYSYNQGIFLPSLAKLTKYTG
jgi:hypothetical protein